jgi:hypothetical protein
MGDSANNYGLAEHNLPEADCFSFAFACIPFQRGLSEANEKENPTSALFALLR